MEQLREILNLALKKADQAEVFFVSSQVTPIRFEANELKQVQTKESNSVALRIFRKGRIGFALATGLVSPSPEKRGEDRLERLVEMAVETSQFGNPASFQLPCSRDYAPVSIFDPQVEKVTTEKMIEMGRELVAKIRQHTPHVLCDVVISKGKTSVALVNSQGAEANYEKSLFTLTLEGTLVRNTDLLFVGDSESSCHLPAGIDDLAGRIIRQLEMAKRNASVSSRVMPVVFTPRGVASVFLAPLALAFNGRTVLERASPLTDKSGKQIFDRKFSLWDDATISYRIGSYPCDDEGIAARRVPLVTNGTVSNFLYDLQTAALAGTQSTGNGRRIGGAAPRPAMTSLIISPGELSWQEMIANMKEGLVVEQVMGAEQGNLFNGDFGGNVLLGYKVENGEIVGRVKDTMIAGNIYQILKDSIELGKEAIWVDGVLFTPPLYCPRVSVTTKGK